MKVPVAFTYLSIGGVGLVGVCVVGRTPITSKHETHSKHAGLSLSKSDRHQRGEDGVIDTPSSASHSKQGCPPPSCQWSRTPSQSVDIASSRRASTTGCEAQPVDFRCIPIAHQPPMP